jgi:hypothetical protein
MRLRIFFSAAVGITATAHPAAAQHPEDLEPSEVVGEILSGDPKAVSVAAGACPDTSAWRRQVWDRVLDDSNLTDETIGRVVIPLMAMMQMSCEWEPARAWFRRALLVATNPATQGALLRAVDETWRPEDRRVILEFALRDDVWEGDKQRALMIPAVGRSVEDRVDWYVEVYEAGALTPGFRRMMASGFATGEAADVFVSRGARALRARPDAPGAKQLMGSIGTIAWTEEAVRPSSASVLLQTLEELSGRPGFEEARGLIPRVREAAGGG